MRFRIDYTICLFGMDAFRVLRPSSLGVECLLRSNRDPEFSALWRPAHRHVFERKLKLHPLSAGLIRRLIQFAEGNEIEEGYAPTLASVGFTATIHPIDRVRPRPGRTIIDGWMQLDKPHPTS